MQALRKHIEKILLGVCLLIVLGVSYFLLTDLRKARSDSFARAGVGGKGGPVPALTVTDFTALDRLASRAVEWRTPAGARANPTLPGVFTRCVNPECTYWIPYTAKTCPSCKTEQPEPGDIEIDNDPDKDGIPSTEESKYAFMDSEDPRDADRDEDGDGFSNKEEIMGAKTDPANPDSHPPLATHVRLHDVVKDRFGIMFDNLMAGGEDTPPDKWDLVLKVREADGQWKSRFTKLGQTVNGYKVIDVQRKVADVFDERVKANVKTDRSEVVLQQEGEPPVTLVRREPQWSGVAFRLIHYAGPRQRRQFTVKAGETLTLTSLRGREEKYTLLQDEEGRVYARLQTGREDAPVVPIERGPSPYPVEERTEVPPGGGVGPWPGLYGPGGMTAPDGSMTPAPTPVVPRR